MRLTTDHPASSYGIPVLVDGDGRAYGREDRLPDGRRAWEYVEGQREPRMAAGSSEPVLVAERTGRWPRLEDLWPR